MDPFTLGYYLGCAFIFLWVPYVCYSTISVCLPEINMKKKPVIPQAKPKAKPKAKLKAKPKKRKYTPVAQTQTCSLDEGLKFLGVSLEILKSYVAMGQIRTYKQGDGLVLNLDDVVKVSKKPGKRVYPVLNTFKDEHKITNPVEFST